MIATESSRSDLTSSPQWAITARAATAVGDGRPFNANTVVPSPFITVAISPQGANFWLTWSGRNGPYQVQMATDLANPVWQSLGAALNTNRLLLSPTNAGLTNFSAQWFSTTNSGTKIGKSLEFDDGNNRIWQRVALDGSVQSSFDPSTPVGTQAPP